ncbi:hypothetical protein [Peribacillus simplex]
MAKKNTTETKQGIKKVPEQINEIVTNKEEKIHLERLFFKVCLESLQ